MDIIILSHFCMDFSREDNDRFLYIAKLLAEAGHDVEIVTSDFYHAAKKHRDTPKAPWPFRITFLHEPAYPRNVCLKRFQSHRIWGKNVNDYIRDRKKPDVIYCAVPSLTGPNLVAKYCEKNHIRFVIDIQDLWPEAFQMIVQIPVISDLAFRPFKTLADGIYRRADAICAVSDTYRDRGVMVNPECKTLETVFLGTELATFDRYASEGAAPEKKRDDEIRLAYCGTLGSSYDLTCVFDALARLNDPRIRFFIMGDGPKTEEFRQYARQKGVWVEFTGRIPYDRMCCILGSCDITVNPIMHMAAQSIINKHADYAASGLPVINTQENEEYRKLVDDYEMGFNCRNNDEEDMAVKLKKLIDNPELRERMGRNARRCAEERFDRKNTYPALVRVITESY